MSVVGVAMSTCCLTPYSSSAGYAAKAAWYAGLQAFRHASELGLARRNLGATRPDQQPSAGRAERDSEKKEHKTHCHRHVPNS